MTDVTATPELLEAMRLILRNQYRLGQALGALAQDKTLARIAEPKLADGLSLLSSEAYRDADAACDVLCPSGRAGGEAWLSEPRQHDFKGA